MDHDLRLVSATLARARRGRRMTANIGLAWRSSCCSSLPCSASLGLAGVVLVHEIAEVIVILNGVRTAQRAKSVQQLTRTPVTPVTPEPAPGIATAVALAPLL